MHRWLLLSLIALLLFAGPPALAQDASEAAAEIEKTLKTRRVDAFFPAMQVWEMISTLLLMTSNIKKAFNAGIYFPHSGPGYPCSSHNDILVLVLNSSITS